MIRRPARRGKDADGRFAEPPWDKSSPQWQQIDARVPADHLARLARRMNEMVEQLDPSNLFGPYDGHGSKAYRPDLPLKMILYDIQCGKPSPAQ